MALLSFYVFPQTENFREAAGLGFEPKLTDPGSVPIHPQLFTGVQKTACSGPILKSYVSHRSPMFTPVTVKSLSNGLLPETISVTKADWWHRGTADIHASI